MVRCLFLGPLIGLTDSCGSNPGSSWRIGQIKVGATVQIWRWLSLKGKAEACAIYIFPLMLYQLSVFLLCKGHKKVLEHLLSFFLWGTTLDTPWGWFSYAVQWQRIWFWRRVLGTPFLSLTSLLLFLGPRNSWNSSKSVDQLCRSSFGPLTFHRLGGSCIRF